MSKNQTMQAIHFQSTFWRILLDTFETVQRCQDFVRVSDHGEVEVGLVSLDLLLTRNVIRIGPSNHAGLGLQ